MLLWIPIMAQVCWQWQMASGSEYGYDSASACGRELRKERARELPCDFQQQNWCTVAGNTYPWHAVRRFVQENHGLMRRMYGDERHIAVLQQELETNEIDTETARTRYSERPRDRHLNAARPQAFYSNQIDANVYFADDENEHFADSDSDHSRLLRHEDVLMNTKFTFADAEFRPNDLFTMPHFRQSITTTTAATTSPKHGDFKPMHVEPDTIMHEVASNDLEIEMENYTSVVFEDTSRNGSAQNESTSYQNETTAVTENTTVVPEEITTELWSTIEDTVATVTDKGEENTTIRLGPLEETDQFSHEYEDDVTVADDMEEQLFQDVDQDFEESNPEPVKLKGVNACPVKEEVVAPFWANNTRGEVLALLNLYPFEQYVHWEKCTYEHKQMYCREGCRCEQQYRLHRLLAYDPNNECRGIFSDWFRFPSCCVCKCYDMPTEFRVTSRSPRLKSRPRTPRVQARRAKIDPEWYRPQLQQHEQNV